MIQNAIRSLKNDFDRTLFFWVVFVIASMFIYAFFHLSMSDVVGFSFFNGQNNISGYLTGFNVCLCMLVIFLANDFFVKKKSRDLAIMTVCGATFIDLVEFLMIQVVILLVTAIPTGIILGKIGFPIIEKAMGLVSGGPIKITSTNEAFWSTFGVMGFVVMWSTLVNLGYTYRCTAYTLLNGEQKVEVQMPKLSHKLEFLRYGWLILYIGGAIGILLNGDNPGAMFALGGVGAVSLSGCIKKILYPYLDRVVQEKYCDDAEKMLYVGFFRADLKIVETYVILFIVTCILLATIIASSVQNSAQLMLCLVSFVMLVPLLALSLMFRFSVEVLDRRKYFKTLGQLGFMEDQLIRVMKKEVILLYGFIMVVSLLYVGSTVFALVTKNIMPLSISLTILAAFIIPLIISGFLSYWYYRRSAL